MSTQKIPRDTSNPSLNDGLSVGAIAGIVIGIIVIFLLCGISAFLFYLRKRTQRHYREERRPGEIDTTFAGGEVKHHRISELSGSEVPHSPQTLPTGYYGGSHTSISELPPDSAPAELWSPPSDDLDGSTVVSFAVGPRPRRRGAIRSLSPPRHGSDTHDRIAANLGPPQHGGKVRQQTALDQVFKYDKGSLLQDLTEPHGESKSLCSMMTLMESSRRIIPTACCPSIYWH